MTALRNPGFEFGDVGWDKGTGWSIVNDPANARTGNWCAKFDGTASADIVSETIFTVRPGDIVSFGGWWMGEPGSGGQGETEIRWLDHGGNAIQTEFGAPNISPTGSYAESSLVGVVAPARAKGVLLIGRVTGGTFSAGTWYFDDASITGDFIEPHPSVVIVGGRMTGAEIVGTFDPIFGSRAFSKVNSGMSDRWRGRWDFEPLRDPDLAVLRAWLARVGRTGRFLAYDPNYTGPAGGVVTGMVVDGAGQTGSMLAVRGGPASTTPLRAGEYIEVGAQLFVLREDLELDTAGKGIAHIWPAIRVSPADGEDVITDSPSCVARLTDVPQIRTDRTGIATISIAWEEVV